MRVLIVGCGYVGLPVGAALVEKGHEVSGLRRGHAADAALKEAGLISLQADITNLGELSNLPDRFDWVVNTVSSTKGGVEEYRQVYVEGMRNLVAWLGTSPPAKFVYTSSTSVYGQTDGSWVDERSPAEASSGTCQVLLEAEEVLLGAAGKAQAQPEAGKGASTFPGVILRAAGIYGPDRGYWLRQFLRGEATIEGRGERYLNMIHRDDLVGLILAALERGRPGEIYNAVDDEPVTQADLFGWLAQRLSSDLPPSVTEQGNAPRKRAVTNKRVANRKAREELGYDFIYPTFREGYAAEIRRDQEGPEADKIVRSK